MLSSAERDLLALVDDEDGLSLIILAHPDDLAQRTKCRETAMSLLARGLIEAYRKPDDVSALPPVAAEVVLTARESWDPDLPTTDPLWSICASAAGNAELHDT